MATKREVDFWKDQCRELTAALDRSCEDKDALTARIWDNSEEAKTARAIADGLEWQVEELEAENAKLRELAERAWKAAEMLCQAWEGPCHADGVSIKPPCPLNERDELCVYGLIQRDLRELGVEVP